MAEGCGPSILVLLLLLAAGGLMCAEEIVGHLTVTQAEANGTSFTNGHFLTTNSKVTLSFLIHDPNNFFRKAKFNYTWNFGDGSTEMTTEPFTYHRFSEHRLYYTSLLVTAHLHRSKFRGPVWKTTGSFNTSFILQDIIRNITIPSSLQTTTEQNDSMCLYILGSPPLAVCWLIKSDCVYLDEDECHPIIINNTTYVINHIFKVAGRYYLSFKAQNEGSTLVDHYFITVDSEGEGPLLFVIPWLALVVTAVGFIFFSLFRASRKNPNVKALVEVADFDFSPGRDKYETLSEYDEISLRGTCCIFCCEDKIKKKVKRRLRHGLCYIQYIAFV